MYVKKRGDTCNEDKGVGEEEVGVEGRRRSEVVEGVVFFFEFSCSYWGKFQKSPCLSMPRFCEYLGLNALISGALGL